jgi:hypothetical protein
MADRLLVLQDVSRVIDPFFRPQAASLQAARKPVKVIE